MTLTAERKWRRCVLVNALASGLLNVPLSVALMTVASDCYIVCLKRNRVPVQ